MITLTESKKNELVQFHKMEQDSEVNRFIGIDQLSDHQECYDNSDSLYLTILKENRPIGFLILILDSGKDSVEFKRIVLSHRGKGFGQSAISEMESYCKHTLGRNRIWLDVLESNSRGQHIYKKMSYVHFKTERDAGQNLYLFEKFL